MNKEDWIKNVIILRIVIAIVLLKIEKLKGKNENSYWI